MLDQHEKIVRSALGTRPTMDKPKSEHPPVPEMVESIVSRAEELLRQASCHSNFPTHVLVMATAIGMELEELLGLKKPDEKSVEKQDAKKA